MPFSQPERSTFWPPRNSGAAIPKAGASGKLVRKIIQVSKWGDQSRRPSVHGSVNSSNVLRTWCCTPLSVHEVTTPEIDDFVGFAFEKCKFEHVVLFSLCSIPALVFGGF